MQLDSPRNVFDTCNDNCESFANQLIKLQDIVAFSIGMLLSSLKTVTLTSHLSHGTPLLSGLLNHCATRQSVPGREHILLQTGSSLSHLSSNTLPQSNMSSSSTTLVSSVRPRTTQDRCGRRSTTYFTDASLRHSLRHLHME